MYCAFGLAQIALLKLKRPISAAAPTELTVPGAGGGKIKISSQPATCCGVFALESLECGLGFNDLSMLFHQRARLRSGSQVRRTWDRVKSSFIFCVCLFTYFNMRIERPGWTLGKICLRGDDGGKGGTTLILMAGIWTDKRTSA